LRGKGIVPSSFYSIFSADTVRYVYDAYQRLQVTTIRDIYTKEDIDGLGENFLRERVRQQALNTYMEYLERYVLESIVTLVVNDPNLQTQPIKELRRMAINETNKDIIRIVALPETFDELLKRYRQLEKEWFERVTHGLDKDNERGRAIFDDYDDAHPIDKGFSDWEKNRVEEKLRRLGSIAKVAKPE
jgi:folate-binding Fe-S cluster repair protein YgfZ